MDMDVCRTSVTILIMTFYTEMLCITVIESCNIVGENCISKPRNSTCIDHNTYLNYTNDIDYLLQLENTAVNYIEANVSNQYCRNYLKAALCVTIYPPCNGSGVQKLCYEQCNGLLNNGMCSSDANYLIQYVNSMSSNPYTNFTINCFDSLNFLTRLSNANPCQSSNCVSLLEIAEFPASCTHLEFSGEGSCSKYSLSLNHMTFKYTSDKNFTELLDLLQSVEILLRNSITSGCTSPTGIFLCNLVFIPCNLTTGTPRPLCSRSCSIFSSACTIEFDTVLTLAGALGIPFTNDCENTFHHINARYGYPNSSNDFEDDCYDLPNLPDVPAVDHELSTSSVVEPTYTIIVTSNTASSYADIITSSMADKITESVMNSSMVNTSETFEHGSNNQTMIPVILAFVFGGILGLCIVVCIAGLILRRQKKKRQNKHHGFILATSNPLFDRITSKMKKKDSVTVLNERLFAMEILKKQCQGLLLPKCDIKLITELGEGEFGRVYKGTWVHVTTDGNTVSEVVAVKTIKSCSSMEVLESFIHESALMKNFDHPNILHILGVGLDPDNGLPFIVLPFMVNGNLQMYLKSKRTKATNVDQLPEGMGQNSLLDICYQIACGMNYLVEKRFIHRDLAARNCMVGNALNIKVADFGLAKDVYMTDYYRQQSIEKMPVKWMAPEALHDRISNEKTDVWSYGITCWEVFSLGRTPYPTIPNEELLEFVDKGNRLPKPELCNDEMYSLMLKCWETDVDSRVCFEEIVIELNEEVSKGYVIETLDDNDNNVQMDSCYTVL